MVVHGVTHRRREDPQGLHGRPFVDRDRQELGRDHLDRQERRGRVRRGRRLHPSGSTGAIARATRSSRRRPEDRPDAARRRHARRRASTRRTATASSDRPACRTRSRVPRAPRSRSCTAATVVRTVYSNRSLAAGTYGWTWNGRNAAGDFGSRGSYTLRLTATSTVGTTVVNQKVLADTFRTLLSAGTRSPGQKLTVAVGRSSRCAPRRASRSPRTARRP